MPAVIQVKRGTASSWTSANTVLAAGEIGFETDTKKMKVGDGSTTWTSLAYSTSDGDITGVTAGTGLSGGGTSGAVTLTNTVATAFDAAGDLIYGTAADTVARLGIGTAGQVLKVNSGATAPEWGTVGGGGKVLQVLQDTANTGVGNSTQTYAATGLSQGITCSSASSKVLVMVSLPIFKSEANSQNALVIRIKRDSTAIIETAPITLYTETTLRQYGQWAYSFLDSPASTSSLTYAVDFKNRVTASEVAVCNESGPASIVLLEIGA